jgi:2-dehydropantoate 2-reductase
MKIAVVGSGSVGCFYGARLARCGHDVSFLMRRDLGAVRRDGLTIKSCEGDFHLAAKAFGDPAEIGEADLVVCALKATAIDAAESLIRPCVGPKTRVLALMNGLGIEERFVEWFGPDRIFGGMAFVCINRGEPGVVHHMAYGRVAFGHFVDDLDQAGELAKLFADAGIETSVRPSLRQARWEKLMWNIPFSTLAVTAGGVTTGEIFDDPGLRELARTLMLETARAGNADGCRIDVDRMVGKMMSNTRDMPPYRPSMLIDYLNKQPLEVEAILGEPVRRAAKLQVPVPTIETQYRLASFLDRLNRGVVRLVHQSW